MRQNRKTRRRLLRSRSREQRVRDREAKRIDMLIEVDASRIVKGKPAKYMLRKEDPEEVLDTLAKLVEQQYAD